MPNPATDDPQAVIQEWIRLAHASGGEQDVYESKREHHRCAWHEPLEIRVGDEIAYVQSRDISTTGLGLVCRRKLNAGDVVHVRRNAGEPWVRTRVTHATQSIGSFRVGVELTFDVDG